MSVSVHERGRSMSRPRPAQSEAAAWWHHQGRSERWLPFDRALATVGFLALWQLAVALELLNPRLIPSPTSIAVASWELAQLPEIQQAMLAAGIHVGIAFTIAATVGVLVGAAIGLSTLLYRVFHPSVMMLFATPKLIFLPLFVLVFGIGDTSRVAYGAVSGVLPVIVTVVAGVRSVEKKLLDAALSMGARRRHSILYVSIPAALPSVFVALWYGIKHALMGVLIMELFISRMGIGFYIRSYTTGFRPDRAFALIIAISLFAILVSQVVKAAEVRASSWRKVELQ